MYYTWSSDHPYAFNPLGGCLPIIIQMPVFFALFTVAKQVPADAHFLGILPSLSTSAADMFAQHGIAGSWVYILLDLLFGVLTFIPMMMNLNNTAEDQRKTTLTMGAVMAVMMLWFGWSVPGAVLLYYDTSAGHPAEDRHPARDGQGQARDRGQPGEPARQGRRRPQGEEAPPPQEGLELTLILFLRGTYCVAHLF